MKASDLSSGRPFAAAIGYLSRYRSTLERDATTAQRQPSVGLHKGAAATRQPAAEPQDAFARWAALQAWSSDATNRLDEQRDLAFWEHVADDYDAGALAYRVPAVLDRVRSLVPANASVLDVGAGTGLFALALASHASTVTALDYSPAMLAVLERKLLQQPAIANVRPILARWEDALVEPHDVVLAANALYRTVDLRLALAKMVAVARQRGIIIWSVGRQDAPQHTLRERVQPGHYRPGPDYVHVVEALFDLDIFAHVEIIQADDTQHYASDSEAAEGLLSWAPISADEHAAVARLLPHLLEPDGSGWRWRRRGRIAVIWWDHE